MCDRLRVSATTAPLTAPVGFEVPRTLHALP
jgi:hypothetical protein